VYLDAFVPEDGRAVIDLLPPERRDVFVEQARTAGEGWRVPAPPPEFYGVTDEADLAWVRPRLGPQPLATFTEPLRLRHPGASPPRTYVACTASTVATFRPFAERARADAAWRYRELATGHDAMVVTPRALAQLLLEVG
jgi:hypothetical protein